MLGYVYNKAHAGALTSNQDLGVKVTTPVDKLIQLLFGWLADVVGRKRMCTYNFLDPAINLLYLTDPD